MICKEAKTRKERLMAREELSMSSLYVGCFEIFKLIKLQLNILSLLKDREKKTSVQFGETYYNLILFGFCFCIFMCGVIVAITKLTDKNKVHRKYSYNNGEH